MTSERKPGDSLEPQSPCPCGSGASFRQCCARFLSGEGAAPTAELLMRSRYSAFVLQDEPYLLATWHPETRPTRVRFNAGDDWLGLQVRSTRQGQHGDCEGWVEFVARVKNSGRATRLHETSRFECIDDQWYYRDGEHH